MTRCNLFSPFLVYQFIYSTVNVGSQELSTHILLDAGIKVFVKVFSNGNYKYSLVVAILSLHMGHKAQGHIIMQKSLFNSTKGMTGITVLLLLLDSTKGSS